jgi:hypothetical protein
LGGLAAVVAEYKLKVCANVVSHPLIDCRTFVERSIVEFLSLNPIAA